MTLKQVWTVVLCLTPRSLSCKLEVENAINKTYKDFANFVADVDLNDNKVDAFRKNFSNTTLKILFSLKPI